MRARRAAILCLVVTILLLAFRGTPPSAQTAGKGEPSGSIADYDGLLKLLENKVTSKQILQRLKESSTHFTLSEEQLKALKARGASPALIDELRRLSVRDVESDVRNIAIVLDCSGSMLDRMPDGSTKMDVAKKVVTDFVRRIRNGKNLTFIVYGTEPKKKCEDVHTVLPLTEVTDKLKNDLVKYIDNIVPLGQTPLAKSMRIAGAQLEKGGQALCMLVVITDGMESCKGDPGAVADELATKLNLSGGGVDLIGLGVEPEEMRALSALARSSLKVREAKKAADLAREVEAAVEDRKKKEREAAAAAAALAADIPDRLKSAKASSGELEIALAWSNKNDLDLHVIAPSGEKIWWKNTRSSCGGAQDVDMNVTYEKASLKPVEHIVWPKKAPVGHYTVYVHHFANHRQKDCEDPTPFVVTVRADSKITTFRHRVSFDVPAQRLVLVTGFTLDNAGRVLFDLPRKETSNPPAEGSGP